MRGNPRNQAGQIFRSLDRIGASRHVAKQDAKVSGIVGSHNTAQHVGIFSYATMTKYRAIGEEFLRFCRDECGVSDAAKVQPEHVREWLQIKIAKGIRYKTYATYAACLNKMSAGLNSIYKRADNWSAAINATRKQARSFLNRDVKNRGYIFPDAIIANLDGIHQIAAEIQFQGGARVKEINHLTEKHLLGDNIILLTNTKGGRRREMRLPPGLYDRVADIIRANGEFCFEYRSYLEYLKDAASISGQKYTGSHGLRWNFAQKAVREAQEGGLGYDDALKEVSERMGHSRKEITEHYLR